MIFRMLVVTIAVFMLTACSTLPESSVERLTGDIPAGSGLVVAETITNGRRITGAVNTWDELILWRSGDESEDNTYTLSAVPANRWDGGARQYMGHLPEGEYRVGLLWSEVYSGETQYWAKALVPPILGTFEVKAGQVTNLGLIVFHPFQAKSWASERMPDYAITRKYDQTVWDKLAAVYPEIASKVNAGNIISWQEDDNTETLEKAFSLMKKSGRPRNIELLDGHIVIYGELGFFRNISNDRSLDFSHNSINDVVALNADTWYAVGDSGTFVRIDSQGDGIHKFDEFGLDQNVISVNVVDSKTLAMITMKSKTYEIYIFDIDSKTLSPLKKFEQEKRGALFTYVSRPVVDVNDDVVSVYMHGKRHDYDLVSSSWSLEEDPPLSVVYRQVNGTIIDKRYNNWSPNSVAYSVDDGKTWKEYQAKNPTDHIFYRYSDGTFVKIGNTTEYKFFGSGHVDTEAAPVLMSKDDGLTWSTIGQLPVECKDLASEASTDSALLVLCEDGQVMKSQDYGKHWDPLRIPLGVGFNEFPNQLKVKFTDN